VTKSLGIDYETIKMINPALNYCSIQAIVKTGPYSNKGGFDLVAQCMSGLMSMDGTRPGRRPVKPAFPFTDIGAGITAVYSIFAGVHPQNEYREGQQIDYSHRRMWLALFTLGARLLLRKAPCRRPPAWLPSRIRPAYQRPSKTQGYGYMMLGCA